MSVVATMEHQRNGNSLLEENRHRRHAERRGRTMSVTCAGLHLASRLCSTNSSSAKRNDIRKLDLDTPRSPRLQVRLSVPVSQKSALCVDSHALLMPLGRAKSGPRQCRPFMDTPGSALLGVAAMPHYDSLAKCPFDGLCLESLSVSGQLLSGFGAKLRKASGCPRGILRQYCLQRHASAKCTPGDQAWMMILEYRTLSMHMPLLALVLPLHCNTQA